jgi:hypothetical protein
MTASYAKPFKACQFIRDNKLKGTVFNYWTEGGFIAYGQIPDPNTGKTPLQLYMDGRAQAAYNTASYQHWMYIMSGGDIARRVQQSGRAFTASDYRAIGNWIEENFQRENVEVVLMPSGEFDSELVKGLDADPNWRTVFVNDQQRMYIDIKSQQGKELYLGLFTGQTKFPDEFTKLLTVGYNLLRMQDENEVKTGYDLIVQAFMRQPSQIVTMELIRAVSWDSQFRNRTTDIFSRYFDDFVEKKQSYAKQNGYRHRIIVAMQTGNYLMNMNRENADLTNKYKTYLQEFSDEQRRIGETARW